VCCTRFGTAWRSSPRFEEYCLRLLLPPPPLLQNASLEIRRATGGGHATEGGGRRGPRGGSTALSLASTHPQPRRPPPQLSQLSPDKPSFQQTPRHCQQLYPRCCNQSHCLRCSVSRHSRLRHCRCYPRRHRHRRLHHRSWHPLRVNGQKQSVRRPGLVAGLQSWPKNIKSHRVTNVFRRPLHHCSRLPVRWGLLRCRTLRYHQPHS
jgi:hypothetical protein